MDGRSKYIRDEALILRPTGRLYNATRSGGRFLTDETGMGILRPFVSFEIIFRKSLFGYGACSFRQAWNSFANIATKLPQARSTG